MPEHSLSSKILGLAPRFTAPTAKPRRYGLQVGCVKCGCKLEDPKIEITLLGPIEKNDHLIAFAKMHGWTLGRDGNRAWVLCPACQKSVEKAEVGPLPAFAEVCPCAKCGNADMGIKFCDGRTFCELGAARDHLHRGCPRCGYSFVQACKDEQSKI